MIQDDLNRLSVWSNVWRLDFKASKEYGSDGSHF
jgi:hypothetical protein